MEKFVFEYPIDWVRNKDLHNIVFLNNITSNLIEMNLLLSFIPVSYPTYGISRPNTKNYYLSFHSYENPKNIWSYKESPIKGLYSIDPSGYGGWSDIAQNLDKYQKNIISIRNADEILDPYINQLKSGISKYKQSKNKINIQDDFILLALQVRTDSVADHAYLDVVDVLSRISFLAEKYKKRIVIKLHPKCDSELLKAVVFKLTQQNKWILVSNSDITQLIQLSHCILACNSGVSLEALILNKKVYCFGNSEWASITNQITELNQLEEIFINYDQAYSLTKYQKQYLAFLVSSYWVKFDDKSAIKMKLQSLIESHVPHKFDFDAEEEVTKNFLDAQKNYTKKIKQINLIERDFYQQNNFLKHIRTNPFFVIIYFFKFNILKLKNKIGFKK